MFSLVQKVLRLGKILTFVSLSLLLFAVQTSCDLAPNEDDDDNEKPPIVKEQNLVNESTTEAPTSNLGFVHAFIASFSVIIVSEIGDKTFFIAAIMSMVSQLMTFTYLVQFSINIVMFLEISSVSSFRWRSFSTRSNDRFISRFRNGIYSLHSSGTHSLGICWIICCIRTEDAA